VVDQSQSRTESAAGSPAATRRNIDMTSMPGDHIPVEIEGAEPAQLSTPPSRSAVPDEAALTRAAFAERARAQGELLEARRDEVATRLYAVAAKSDFAKKEIERANEAGDFGKLAEKQQEIAALEAERHSLTLAADRLSRAQVPVGDPIEAFISGRASATQAWLRSHPDDARALALTTVGQASVDDQRRSAKINAAHNDALAEGFAADTPQYFNYVEQFLERRSRPGRSSGESEVNFVRPGDPIPAGHARLTQAEYQKATDGTLVWNYGPKKGQPLGAKEYVRRREAMRISHPTRLD
jgi:hypothetical protein